MRQIAVSQSIAGCLIGQCLGDALGYPVEGRSAEECSSYVQKSMNRWFLGEEPHLNEWSGQYTDDSQLARELMESLELNEGWNPEDYAARIAKIFQEKRIVGRGLACDEAARQLNAGAHWKWSGVPSPSVGNGTAMRVAPVGLFYYDRPEEMVRVAHEQGWITHHDSRCSAGSVAIAGAVALAVQGDVKNIREFASRLSEWMSGYDREFAALVLELLTWVSLDPNEAAREISGAGKPKGHVDGWPGISPFVVPSVLWSLYAFLRHPDSYQNAVFEAIAVGGDVDTTAAMTEAISGAYLGLQTLPHHLADKVHDQGEWGYDALVMLVKECYNTAASGTTTSTDE